MFFNLTALIFTLIGIDIIVSFYLMNKYTDYKEWKGIDDKRVDRVFLIGVVGLPLFLVIVYVWCIAGIYG